MILIINLGSQYTLLVLKQIRKNGFDGEIRLESEINSLPLNKYDAIIISGGPKSVSQVGKHFKKIFELDIPILGICYGFQLMANYYNAKVIKNFHSQFGIYQNQIISNNKLFSGTKNNAKILMSHNDSLTLPNENIKILSITENNVISAFKVNNRNQYGVQFHPEVTHTENGNMIFHNFCSLIYNPKPQYKISCVKTQIINNIKNNVGDEKVLLALSGGIDSAVCAFLLSKAIGDNFIPIFIDHGFMRDYDVKQIKNIFIKKCNFHVEIVDAKKYFFSQLKNVEDPEKKRKIIGRCFIKILENFLSKHKNITILCQGTIYPDIVESGIASQKIKSHHNVGGLPKSLKLKIIEPIKHLLKEEVRELGNLLQVPNDVLHRHPFPGPGLAIRIIGPITKEKIKAAKNIDTILTNFLIKNKIFESCSQTAAIILNSKSVGVVGDQRRYGYAVVIRLISSMNFMTANIVNIKPDLLEKLAQLIIGECKIVSRVLYDITPKPPGTIEWE